MSQCLTIQGHSRQTRQRPCLLRQWNRCRAGCGRFGRWTDQGAADDSL